MAQGVIPTEAAFARIGRGIRRIEAIDRLRGRREWDDVQPYPVLMAQISESRLWNIAENREWNAMTDAAADAVRQFAWDAVTQADLNFDGEPGGVTWATNGVQTWLTSEGFVPNDDLVLVASDYAQPAYSTHRTADLAVGMIVRLHVQVSDDGIPFYCFEQPDATGMHAGVIVSASGATNANYVVQSQFDGVTTTDVVPINRTFSTSDVTYDAASAGAVCQIIIDRTDPVEVRRCIIFETIQTAECE